MKRKAVQLSALVLLIGAVLQLSVAWALHLLQAPDLSKPVPSTPVSWLIDVPDSWPRPYFTWQIGLFGKDVVAQSHVSGVAEVGASQGEILIWQAVRCQIGWPFRSLESTFLSILDANGSTDLGEALDRGIHIKNDREDLESYLPVRPRSFAFVLNTIVWAMFSFGLIQGGAATRRYLRRRKGRCAYCGYQLSNLRGDRCPECGRDVALAGAAGESAANEGDN